MGSESILDLDEARRRLEQIEREQADILPLVAKLREVHRLMETQARLLEDRADAAEERLSRLRVLARTLRKRGLRQQSDSDQALARLETERQRVADAIEALRNSLEQQHHQWCDSQRALAEASAQKQAAQLGLLSSTWEKEKSDLRTELAALHDEMHTRVATLNSHWKQELAAARAACEGFQSQLGATSREVDQDLVSVRREVRSLVDRRTYLAAAAIGISLLLAAYGLRGRLTQSAADEQRAHNSSSTQQAADAPTPQTNRRTPADAPTQSQIPAQASVPAQAAAQTPSWRQTQTPAPDENASPEPPAEPLPELRTWTDDRGRTAEAEFEHFRNEVVYLKSRHTGKTYPIPLDRLSVPDQAYVRSLLAWRR